MDHRVAALGIGQRIGLLHAVIKATPKLTAELREDVALEGNPTRAARGGFDL